MTRTLPTFLAPLLILAGCASTQQPVAERVVGVADGGTRTTIPTPAGPLHVIALGHGSLVLHHPASKVAVYVDPVTAKAPDGLPLPTATHVVVTHHHGDHLNPTVVGTVGGPATGVFASVTAAAKLPGARSLSNGESVSEGSLKIEAVPAYNLKRRRPDGAFFHPKGEGNGYILTMAGKRIYVSGDTECTPDMKALENIDVAFVCMNLPYTMVPGEAAECVDAFEPKIVFPYHHRGQDPADLKRALKRPRDVRVLDWYPKK